MAHQFWRKETVQVAIVSASAVVLASVTPTLLQLPSVKRENENLRDELHGKTSEIQRLNILLTPFKTIALERYSGNEAEALAKLGLKLHDLQMGLETLSNYQGVARLGPDGKTGFVKEPLREESPLIYLLTDAWHEDAGRFAPTCTSEAIAKFEEAKRKFPDFPFLVLFVSPLLQKSRKSRVAYERRTGHQYPRENHELKRASP